MTMEDVVTTPGVPLRRRTLGVSRRLAMKRTGLKLKASGERCLAALPPAPLSGREGRSAEEAEALVFGAEDRFGGRLEPAIQHGRVDGAEVG